MPHESIEAEARRLRDAVRDLHRPSTTTPIPPALRRRIVRCTARATTAGWSLATLAPLIGVSVGSLRNWQRDDGPVALVPVRVAPAPAAEPVRVSVVAPSGYRVEGLDVPTAAALLRALG